MKNVDDENVVLSNILTLMKAKGVRQKDLADYLGISQNAVAQWKSHKTKSYMKYLDQLAEYFDVTRDDLLHADTRLTNGSYLSRQEQQIVHDFRTLSQNSKDAVAHLLRSLSTDQLQNS